MQTAVFESDQHRQQQVLRYLPFVLLALAAVVGLLTAGATGSDSPGRFVPQVVLVPVTAAWLWSGVRAGGRGGAVLYIGRSLLAAALTALNPLFCIFAWTGYLDAAEVFSGRRLYLAMGGTAVVVAIGQTGGMPFRSVWQLPLFVVLLALNFGLSSLMTRFSLQMEETSTQRAEAITELEQLNADLERVNADLERALSENAALQETVVAQARDAGVQEERQRLAQEIHDTIAQSLAGILAQLQAAQDDLAPRARIARAAELARQALAEARRSVMALAPAPLTGTALAEAVTDLVDAWDADHDARAEIVVTGEIRPLHPEVEATVLRITQETLSNVAKHATAHRVGVTLSYDEAEVILDVRDDGVGFDPDQPPAPTSFGLRGMRQRAERLAGALALESEPGGGTAVSLRLPAVARGVA